MSYLRKPTWLKTQIRSNNNFESVVRTIQENGLHTICTSGRCPNLCECWNKGTATFMILGDICTRSCRFCNTKTGKPLSPDREEPEKVALSIQKMGLKHIVITSVTRDDLPDQGAAHWAETIRSIKTTNPEITIETLIPDLDGKENLLDTIIREKPDIISHNLETVRRLTPEIRTKARYNTSLKVLSYISSCHITAKTGIMVGLGETEDEVCNTMDDVLSTGCDIITIGQYLQPSRNNIPVKEYVTPEKFEQYKQIAIRKGFRHVESAPLVRSSYCAEKHIL